jgi:hypothetical protein
MILSFSHKPQKEFSRQDAKNAKSEKQPGYFVLGALCAFARDFFFSSRKVPRFASA